MKRLFLIGLVAFVMVSCTTMSSLPQQDFQYSISCQTDEDDARLFEKLSLYLPRLINDDGMTAGKMTQQIFMGDYNRGNGKKVVGVNYASKELKIITATGMRKITYSFTPIDTYYELEIKVHNGSIDFLFTDMTNGAGRFTNQAQLDAFKKEIAPATALFIKHL